MGQKSRAEGCDSERERAEPGGGRGPNRFCEVSASAALGIRGRNFGWSLSAVRDLLSTGPRGRALPPPRPFELRGLPAVPAPSPIPCGLVFGCAIGCSPDGATTAPAGPVRGVCVAPAAPGAPVIVRQGGGRTGPRYCGHGQQHQSNRGHSQYQCHRVQCHLEFPGAVIKQGLPNRSLQRGYYWGHGRYRRVRYSC
jgi:hypothetical protein